jgi:hypothetical protein
MFRFAGPAKQAKQATAKAASSAQQGTQQDLGKQLGNVFGGLKLPWQQGNGASSKPQQVCSALLHLHLFWPFVFVYNLGPFSQHFACFADYVQRPSVS